jgi:hypothetical protein
MRAGRWWTASAVALVLLAGAVVAAPAASAQAALVDLRMSARTVDVTTGYAEVTVTARLSRPGGLRYGDVLISLDRSSDAPEPSFWPVAVTSGPRTATSPATFTATFRIPRHAHATVFDVGILVLDPRSLREQRIVRERMLTVLDTDPDMAAPVVRAFSITSPSGFPVDVRTSSRKVHIRFRITDDRAGVGPATMQLRLRHLDPPGVWFGSLYEVPVRRVAGTSRDGWYSAWWTVGKGELAGDWSASLELRDRAHSVGLVHGGDRERGAGHRRLPGASASFRVRGSGDSLRPVVRSVTMAPSATVQTDGDGNRVARVVVSARITDAGAGVRRVVVGLSGPGATESWAHLRPTSGTRADGTWRFVLDVPIGDAALPSALWLHLGVNDLSSQDWYSVPGAAPYDGWRDNRTLGRDVLGGGTGSVVLLAP